MARDKLWVGLSRGICVSQANFLKIAFRVDSSSEIGNGHFVRCLNLAQEFVKRNNEVVFVCSELMISHAKLLKEMGCKLVTIPASKYEIEDASNFLATLTSFQPQIVVVDSYALRINWEFKVKAYAKTLVVIADIPGEGHYCDFLIDQNLTERTEDTWKVSAPNARLLIGPRYALLNSRIIGWRNLWNPKLPDKSRIVVYFGGTDAVNILTKTVNALESITSQSEPAVVVAPKEQWLRVLKRLNRQVDWCKHQEPNESFIELLSEATLAIGAGGVTVWERMYLGINQVLISIAKNQEYSCSELGKRNLATYVGSHDVVTKGAIERAVNQSIADVSNLSKQALEGQILIDGIGSARVVECILPSLREDLSVREAKLNDVTTYFNWANDPSVRSVSLSKGIIEWSEHLAWFEQKIRSKDTLMYVFLAGYLPVGQVRFDFVNDHVELDYSLDIDFRGRGWSKVMLDTAYNELRKVTKSAVIATVESQNTKSMNALMSAGYRRISNEESLIVFLRD